MSDFIKRRFDAKTIATVAILLAAQIVLSRFLSIPTPVTKIGFSFVPVIIAARKYGAFEAAVVSGLGDFLGAILFPIGPYFPGFTLTAVLMAVCNGLFLHRSGSIKAIVATVVINQFVFSLFLNTLWVSLLYGTPYRELLITRLVQAAVVTVVQVLVTVLLVKKGGKAFNQK